MEQQNETNTEVKTEETTGTMYTEEQVLDLVKKESEKAVSQALKTVEKKQREAEKLRGMNADDQREYNLSRKEEELAAREEALLIAENKAECLSILADKGLDVKLVDFVVDSDASVMHDKITKLDKAFKASVKAEVEKRLGSDVPKKNLPMDTVVTKEQFKKMGYAEMMELKTNNPELFDQLKS